MSAITIPDRVKDRFWSRVDVRDVEDCWLWQLSAGSHGYGQVGWWHNGKGHMVLAHRVAWEIAFGEIPVDMTVNHLCYERLCCNPNHMNLLTNEENGADNGAARRTHCPEGHTYDEANTYRDPEGHRTCRTCWRRTSKAA